MKLNLWVWIGIAGVAVDTAGTAHQTALVALDRNHPQRYSSPWYGFVEIRTRTPPQTDPGFVAEVAVAASHFVDAGIPRRH